MALLALVLTAAAVGRAIYRVRAQARDTIRETATAVRPTPPAAASARLVPGMLSVTDALELEGQWVVLDHRVPALHWLDHRGSLLRSRGSAGDGPGELRRPRALARLGDTLVVVSGDGSRLDYFSLTGEFLRRTPLGAEDCAGATLVDMAGTPAPALFVLRQCIDVPRGWVRLQLVRVGPEGFTTEIASADLYDLRGRAGSAFAVPVLAASRHRIYLGVGDGCLRVYQPDGRPAGELCYPERERLPAPPELKRRIAEMKRARPLLSGPAYRPPDHLPPFDAVFTAGENLVWRTFTGLETRALQVWTPGQALPRRLPIHGTEHTFVGSTSVLVAQELVDGIAIAVLPLRLD